jgi:hypothetical protein
MEPRRERHGEGSLHAIRASVVFPKPPAPKSPVVIPTVPARSISSERTTWDISSGLPTTPSAMIICDGMAAVDG